MSTIIEPRDTLKPAAGALLRLWLPVGIAFLLMFVPTIQAQFNGLWRGEDHLHQPISLAIAAWLFWMKRDTWLVQDAHPNWLLGVPLLVLGLAVYIIGRSQDLPVLDIGSALLVVAGVLFVMSGTRRALAMWYPVLFLAFIVPLPGAVLDTILVPLKMLVSNIVENGLYQMGYPIARDGVVLNIGPYRMFIADACSGLNSMISLTAIGTLYTYIRNYPNKLQNLMLVLGILPFAFIANIGRVAALVLSTYYGGDAVGQQVHDWAGALEIAVLMLGFLLFDNIVAFVFARVARAHK
ncbi:exosortase [Chitinivorax sp. PXF-14]|uniref:exosortase n=1 Tax=Chitinivorax sp. PXF-14 TaxID=3230488 RepID=UPI00346799F6